MHGIFLDVSTVTDGDLDMDPLRATLDSWTFSGLTAPVDIAAAIRDADIVVSNKAALDRDAIAAAGRLRLICIAATGTNNVDLDAARAGNIAVCNVQAYATTSVVEHVFMVILALQRRLAEHTTAVVQGRWGCATRFSMLDFPFSELSGKTLGIIGYGELGKAVADMGGAFGMQVLIAERAGAAVRPGRIAFDQLLAQADVISLHCPLTPATENLLTLEAFSKMRTGAILVNTARGGIVNEADLMQALKSGEIAGAAVDVLTTEPPVSGNPLLDEQLPNLVVTPHIAWAGRHARQRLIGELAANISAFLDNRPRNLVA
ncbi:MAG: D-2-hydroxyacid dehydrogenase [Halobacteria archaeon]|nr:D-2-hydroxyacid dehydrogenase [Halobacteria archaeon]